MRWFGYGLMTAGLLASLWGLWVWHEQRTLGEDVRPIHQEAAASPQVAPQAASEKETEPVIKEPDIIDEVVYKNVPKKGERFADLIIPKLDLRLPVVEGTGEKELRKGIGHYTDSVLPGEPDNAVLAGHRESFRDIGRLKKGDRIIVETRDEGTFVFSVKKTWVTDKDDRSVIVSHDETLLTLITCYPFNYIGAAPERYIVQAELAEILR
jgi:sortase A